jgi:hypothetical protein
MGAPRDVPVATVAAQTARAPVAPPIAQEEQPIPHVPVESGPKARTRQESAAAAESPLAGEDMIFPASTGPRVVTQTEVRQPSPLVQPGPELPIPHSDEANPSPSSLREISIRITNERSQTADVRMVERNGEIQVAVRASDAGLANSLRSDMGDLVRGLSPDGISAEVFRPGPPSQTTPGNDPHRDDSGSSSWSHQQDAQGFQQSGHQRRNGERQHTRRWFDEID